MPTAASISASSAKHADEQQREPLLTNAHADHVVKHPRLIQHERRIDRASSRRTSPSSDGARTIERHDLCQRPVAIAGELRCE